MIRIHRISEWTEFRKFSNSENSDADEKENKNPTLLRLGRAAIGNRKADKGKNFSTIMTTQNSNGISTKNALTTWLTIIGLTATTLIGVIKCTDTGRDFYCKVVSCEDPPPPTPQDDPNYEVKRQATFRVWNKVKATFELFSSLFKSDPPSASRQILKSLNEIDLNDVDVELVSHVQDIKSTYQEMVNKFDKWDNLDLYPNDEKIQQEAKEFMIQVTAKLEKVQQDNEQLAKTLSGRYNYDFKKIE